MNAYYCTKLNKKRSDMLFDVSSSDDEIQEQNRTVYKYQCPADFVPFSYGKSEGAFSHSEDGKELWLIKAPAHFDPKCFAGLKVPLSELQMVQTRGPTPELYSVLGSERSPSDLHLLIGGKKNETPSICASDFTGVLNISETYGTSSENQSLVPVPAAPAPCIPPGLKQRFKPFGSSIPAHVEEQVTAVSPAPRKRTGLDPDVSEERRKKKKKRDEHDGGEVSEDVSIKQEQMQVEVDQTEERRKRKKTKKEKKRSEDTVDSSLIYKTEPLDSSYGDVDTPRKSKKKKKSRDE